MNRYKIAGTIFASICSVLLFTGCTGEVRPNPTPTPMESPIVSPVPDGTPGGDAGLFNNTRQGTAMLFENNQVDTLTREIERMPEVAAATVSMAGNTCTVNVRARDNVDRATLKRDVEQRVRATMPNAGTIIVNITEGMNMNR